ncbi:MAG: Gfo/Idh/MocA family protein, partial [Solirubrobacterales bacterium]
ATGKDATIAAHLTTAATITTDVAAMLNDPQIDAVVIASSPREHGRQIVQAVDAGKCIYVEKPMATTLDDFRRVYGAMEETPVLFTMGLNRRYSPLVTQLKALLHEPVQSVSYFVNQQPVPPDHRTVDEFEGGGRLVSEAEHFIDLCNFLIGLPPTRVHALVLGPTPDDLRKLSSFSITLFYDGAVASVVYDEAGSPSFPRERVTVSGRGQIATLDDFARLVVHGKKTAVHGSRKRQMGHRQALTQFVAAVRGEANSMLTWSEASLATLCMFAAQESIRSGQPVDLRSFRSFVATPVDA